VGSPPITALAETSLRDSSPPELVTSSDDDGDRFDFTQEDRSNKILPLHKTKRFQFIIHSSPGILSRTPTPHPAYEVNARFAKANEADSSSQVQSAEAHDEDETRFKNKFESLIRFVYDRGAEDLLDKLKELLDYKGPVAAGNTDAPQEVIEDMDLEYPTNSPQYQPPPPSPSSPSPVAGPSRVRRNKSRFAPYFNKDSEDN
jgi:hypothetical protein